MGTWSIVEGDGASITPNGLVTIPAGSNKTYKIKYQSSDGGCACFHTITQGSVPTCTFTVYSNQNGASVSWRNGSTVVQTGTISMGSHSFNSTASGPLSVYLTKAGCTFPDNGEYCYCDDYVTIDGNCGGGCSSYNYTYASTADIGCEGGTSVLLAYTATCVDDASDWYTGKTTATISEIGCNSSTSTKTYTRTWNGHSITITQAKGDCCSTPSCTCTLTIDDDLSSGGGTNKKVGTWSAVGDCSGSYSISWVSGDTIFTSITPKSNGDVEATFPANTETRKLKAIYKLTGSNGCYNNERAEQKGSSPGEECTCSKAHFSVTGKTIEAGSNVTIAEYTADCDDGAEVRYEGGDNFLSVSNATFSSGKIKISSVSEVSSNKSGNYAVYIDGTRCDGFTVTQNKPSGGEIDKTITLTIQTTQSKIYMSSIDATISLQPKTSGVGSSVTLGGTGWLNEQNCTDWTNNWSQSIHLSGSYTGSISDYNFQVSFQRRVLKKQKTATTCDSLSPTNATGTMNGVGPSSASMSSGGVFSVGLTSESNIGSSIGILLVTQ